MKNLKVNIRRVIFIMPILSIIGMSFYPLQAWVQQVLILFALIWLNVFIFFDIPSR